MHNTLTINRLNNFNNRFAVVQNVQKPLQMSQAALTCVQNNNEPDKLGKTLECLGAISFGSLQIPLRKISLKGLERFISSEIPENSSVYQFMKRNPKGFYLEYGREVNKFLRKGTFDELPTIDESMSSVVKSYIEKRIKEQKELNRTILESLEVMDSKMTSRTTSPITVYRDAPRQWMDTAKDGILSDAAYLSTSTERGASMEGIICNGADNFTYEIRLPKDTPYWDMTDTLEKEMLLGRGNDFKILSHGVLELLPKAKKS